MRYILIIVLAACLANCSAQSKSDLGQTTAAPSSPGPIGDYLIELFEDSRGHLWFGTIEKGVARYDGQALRYFTTATGLPSNRVVSIVEDAQGHLWFGTDQGLSQYDGNSFTHYGAGEGLDNTLVSTMLIDRKGNFWVGTWGGVYQFDGKRFAEFAIPYPIIETNPNEDTKDWVTAILEDANGAIWFARDGYGISKYSEGTFTHLTKKDGLNANTAQALVEDAEGNIWIGTRVGERDQADADQRSGQGGLNKYNGQEVVHFPALAGLHKSDVYALYKDRAGHIWISTTGHGVYRYDGTAFKHYAVPKSSMNFMEDQTGNLWIGCAGGLYRLQGKKAIPITTAGPWL